MRGWCNGILRFWVAMAACVCLGACDVHEFPCDDAPVDVECELDVEIDFDLKDMPWFTTVEYHDDGTTVESGSRAQAQQYDFRYQLFVFDNSRDDSRTPVGKFVFTTSDTDNLSRTLRFRLPPGDYTVRVWADFVDSGSEKDKFYDTSDLTSITVKTDANGDLFGNEHHRNAFLGTAAFTVPEEAFLYAEREDGQTYVVHARCVMDRPLARYEFVTTDFGKLARDSVSPGSGRETLDEYTVRVRYTGYMPSKFNFFSDRPVDSLLGMGYNARITRVDKETASLGFDYVFVGDSESAVDVALDVYDKDGVRIASTDPIKVPLQRGHYTLIRGDFLSTEAHGGIGIDPEFSGEYNIEII